MKKNRKATTFLSLAMIGSLGTTLTWSETSHACAYEPYLSSVCLMALTGSQTNGFGNTYLPALGQILPVNGNQALYSLLGNTYGGNSPSSFALPDLRGRVIIGAGVYTDSYGTTVYQIGTKGGDRVVTVPVPAHIHGLSSARVQYSPGTLAGALDMSTVAFNTSLSGVTATTSLMGVTAATSFTGLTASIDGSTLTLNGSGTGGTLNNSPNGTSLTTTTLPTRIYSSAAPSVAMAAGSIQGTAAVKFNGTPTTTLSGTPTTALTGTPTTTITGTPKVNIVGAPTLQVGGATDIAGSQTPYISTMQPYVVMGYFIATQNALYPVAD